MRRELLLIAQIDGVVKSRFSEVPWAQPVRLRNRIIHGYWSVDLEILHTAATESLPALVEQLQRVLAVMEAEPPGD